MFGELKKWGEIVVAESNDVWGICVGGKRDVELILPTNGSISVTLDMDQVTNK